MEAFKLDVSGEVRGSRLIEMPDGNWRSHWAWEDLSPFAQGYVEALFASLERENDQPTLRRRATGKIGSGLSRYVGFSDLSPEALARIIADCAEAAPDGGLNGYPPTNASAVADARGAGAEFWRRRNKFTFKRFPPLLPTLSDDGLIYFREQA